MFELHQATYDVTTGEEVPVERILAAAGGDPATALARTRAVLCGPTVAEVFPISRLGECTDIPVTRAHPTEHGVWLGFTRDDLHLGNLMEELFLPWSLIASAEVA